MSHTKQIIVPRMQESPYINLLTVFFLPLWWKFEQYLDLLNDFDELAHLMTTVFGLLSAIMLFYRQFSTIIRRNK